MIDQLWKPSRVRRAISAMLLTSCLAAFGTGLGAIAANAYTTSGCKWSSANLNYVNFAAGTYTAPASAATSSWSSGTDVNLTSSSSSTLTIATTYNTSSAVGTTTRSCNQLGIITAAAMYGNTYHLASQSTNGRRAAFGHEIGHGLGLNHSAGPSAMMYAYYSMWTIYGTYTPGPDDVAGMNYLY